jgi:hypothetical protein
MFLFFKFESTDCFLLFVIFSVFRHLSPVELNRCAIELEKRSIQLSVEEGRFLNLQQNLNTIILPRKKCLNIVSKACLYHKMYELRCYYKILYMTSQRGTFFFFFLFSCYICTSMHVSLYLCITVVYMKSAWSRK